MVASATEDAEVQEAAGVLPEVARAAEREVEEAAAEEVGLAQRVDRE